MGVRKSLLKISSEVFLSSLDLSWLAQGLQCFPQRSIFLARQTQIKKVWLYNWWRLILLKQKSENALLHFINTCCRYGIICCHVVVYGIMLWRLIYSYFWRTLGSSNGYYTSVQQYYYEQKAHTNYREDIFFLLCLTFKFLLHKIYLCSQCAEVWNTPHEPPFLSYFHNVCRFQLENGISITAESQKAEILPVRKPKY